MAAIVLKQNNPGYIDATGVGADAVDKTIDALRMRYNKHPLVGGRWFKSVDATGKGGTWKVSNYGTIIEHPRRSEDSDRIPFATPWKGFKLELTPLSYRLGIEVERKFDEDQIMEVAGRMASGLMNTTRVMMEHSMADVFNNAQVSTVVGGDGVSLSNTAHPFERRQQGTWSNRETAAALTHANYHTARVNMRKRTDEFGDRQPIKPKDLIIPVDLEKKAKEIFQSEKVDDNALNTKNVYSGSVNIVVHDYLTSTTQWLIWGDRDDMTEDKSLYHVTIGQPTIRPTEGQDKKSDIIMSKYIRLRFVDAFYHGKNIQENAGA